MSAGQDRRRHTTRGPGGSGADSEFADHELDQEVPEIEDLLSDIDAALSLADGAIESEEREKAEAEARAERERQRRRQSSDGCTCW